MSQENNQESENKEAKHKQPWDELDVDFIVSVDFGSSGFAAAFCPLGVPSHQRMISDWSDSRAAAELNKNLAALLIDRETKKTISVGYEAEELYSKSKENKEDDKYMYFEHFKPYLYSRDHLEKNIPIPSAGGKSTLPLSDLITKSLESVMSHALNYINGLNTMAGIDLVSKDKIFWVMSVPAIWDEMSKEMMKYCARKAGMTHFELGSEPIASTFHVLNCKGSQFKLRTNDKIMILDCGGGTIDVACITVESDKFDLSELHHSDGIRAGGLDVDTQFEYLLSELLPKDVINTIKTCQPHQWIRQKQEFVLAKFSCPLELREDEAWNVPFCFGINTLMSKKKKKRKQYKQIKKYIDEFEIIDYENKNENEERISGVFKLGRSNIKINKKGWLYLHENVFSKIINFIKNLFNNGEISGCDKVIVVGGFANSKYLINRLITQFPNKTFFTPRQPHLAVVKGALYWICQRRLLSKTRAKYSYGIAIDRKFNPQKDPINRRKILINNGEEIVENAFNVLVSRNEQYEDGYKEDFDYWIPAHADHLEIVLYASQDAFCQYVFDENGKLPTQNGRQCFEVKKFIIYIKNPSKDRVPFQIQLEYNQNGINLDYIDPNDGKSKRVQVDTQTKPRSNI